MYSDSEVRCVGGSSIIDSKEGGNAATTSAPARQTQEPEAKPTTTKQASTPAPVVVTSTPELVAPETTPIPEVQTPEPTSTAEVSPDPIVTTPPVVATAPAPVAEAPSTSSFETEVPLPTLSPIVVESTFATSPSPVVALPANLNTSTDTSTQPLSTTSSLETPVSTTPAFEVTTSTEQFSTSRAIALSDAQPSTTSSFLNQNQAGSNGLQAIASSTSVSFIPTPSPTTASSAEQESSAATGISSRPQSHTVVVGSIVAGVAVIGIIGALLWFCRRRRRNRRGSLLTPLGPPPGEKSYYEIDNSSVGPTNRGVKLKAGLGYQADRIANGFSGFKAGVVGFGSSLKSKIVPERSDTPSVNLNRGNSQFLDGPIPQHSRNNSVLSNSPKLTAKDRFDNWWDRFFDNVIFGWRSRTRKEPYDPFAAARSMSEKQAAGSAATDFAALLPTERELQLQAERRRASLSNTGLNLGSLGLDFSSLDPFADPLPSKQQNSSNQVPQTNPFADPIAQPQPSIQKPRTYVANIRRSRGLSVDDANNNKSAYTLTSAAYRPPSTAAHSRYPSTVAPSRDSYRDTVFSTFSSNVRKGKGRSDPFDLERPELWRPIQQPPVPVDNRTSTRPRAASMAARDSTDYHNSLLPNPLRMTSVRGTPTGPIDSNGAQPRIISVAQPRINSASSSKYSSGMSGLGDWGDPGPDLGPGSSSSSLRGNASSNGSQDFGRGYAELVNSRNRDNVSPISFESVGNGVGKAM
ncbi:hypothetical protein B0O99DRAFT_161886 [Bisporella sp. PMI_857]|nr:hypothetical protein B0O99DRAFT_161886 [Bisporella sp. PMI_857]